MLHLPHTDTQTHAMTMDGGLQSAAPARKNATHLVKTKEKYCTKNVKGLSALFRHLRLSGSGTPATQNVMTTCFETFEKESSCNFPHRHTTTGRTIPTLFTLCSIKIDVFPGGFIRNTSVATSNRCFVQGVRQFSSHVTKRHHCHPSSENDAAALHLPHKTGVDT